MTTSPSTTDRGTSGWGVIVDRITTANTRPEFLAAMLDLQGKVVAAKFGAMWTVAGDNLEMAAAWPQQLNQAPAEDPMVKMLQQAAAMGAKRGSSHVLRIKTEQTEQGHAPGDHVFITVLRSGAKVDAVCTVVADCRDPQVIAVTAPIREMASGLYGSFQARADAEGFRRDAHRVRRTMALLAVAQEARGFGGACLNLVNELATQYKCSRVNLGWVKGRGIRVEAMSDTDEVKRHSEHVTILETAMAECLDQEHALVYPLPSDAEPMLTNAVVHGHRRLTGNQTGRHALSIPLRKGDELIGVVTLERSGDNAEGFDSETIRQLQLICDALGPFLADRRDADNYLFMHAWNSIKWAATYVVGPKHVGWKLAAILVLFASLWFAFGSWDYRVTAEFVLEAQAKRVIPVPYQARLDAVEVEPGYPVNAGDTLARLDDTEFRLQLNEARSQLKVQKLNRAQAMAEGKQSDAQQALAESEQTQARIDLLEYRIAASVIKSPVDGVVLAGYWRDKIGRVMDQGEELFQVAPVNDLVALVRVDESDINVIVADPLPAGELATRSMPSNHFTFQVNRIIPLAEPIGGANTFELRCSLDEGQVTNWLRPGMQGLAKIDAGNRRIAWIATHRVIDTLRLWLWW